MPMMNGYAECFVKSIKRVPSLRSGDKAKRPCLDKMIFFSEAALRKAISEYVLHYHHERPHQGRDNQIIEPDVEASRNQGPIRKIAHLGGLLNHTYREPLPKIEEEEGWAA